MPMTHKIITVGNSSAVTLPRELLKLLKLRVGEKVTIEHDIERGGLVILPLRPEKDEAEFGAWTKEFLKQYGPALKSLAKK